MEKYHRQGVAPIEKENERDENYEASNPQIDSERTRNNYRFTPHFGKTYTEFINGRIKELGLSPRKDAVVMNSFVLGSDKTFFDGLAKIEIMYYSCSRNKMKRGGFCKCKPEKNRYRETFCGIIKKLHITNNNLIKGHTTPCSVGSQFPFMRNGDM